MFGEYEIGRAGKVPAVEAKPEYQAMRDPANDHRRLGVATPDPGHDLARFSRSKMSVMRPWSDQSGLGVISVTTHIGECPGGAQGPTENRQLLTVQHSRRSCSPISPGVSHRSTFSTTDSLYAAVNRRLFAFAETSGSVGEAAALRLPSPMGGAFRSPSFLLLVPSRISLPRATPISFSSCVSRVLAEG